MVFSVGRVNGEVDRLQLRPVSGGGHVDTEGLKMILARCGQVQCGVSGCGEER